MLWIEPSQLSNHLLRKAIAEVVLTDISRQILEWQNRQHGSSVGRLRTGPRTRPLDISSQTQDQDNYDGSRNGPSLLGQRVSLATEGLIHRRGGCLRRQLFPDHSFLPGDSFF